MSVMIQNASSDPQSADNAKQDLFNEVLVKQRWSALEYGILGLIIAGTFVILFLLLMFIDYVLPFIPLLFIALIFGIYFLIKNMRREYEYIATNGHLDIDRIIAKSKRKRVLSLSPSEIDEVAPLAESQALKNKSKNLKILDCSSREKDADIWCVSGRYKDKQTLVLFDANDKIINNLRRFSPNKVKRK